MIGSVLVANRGEIARRVFRTCRALGIGCVAVYSDADAASPHVSEADAAVRLLGSAPSETYLRADLIVEAAQRLGADAIHPGYGFLAESAEFARAVVDAGLTWIGPPASVIESMGSKVEAKRLMAAAGVPVLPELDPRSVAEDDLPVLIKASAGGGGRGMRVVRRIADLPAEIEAARSEALSAFGDGTVFCEPYLATGRHIEVQVLADSHGTIWTVGERECSIQRRHQKVIEETPSPLVTPGTRSELFEAARAAATAIGYVGAGTIEFLADSNGRFFFLETNTRLQVEHPVTECTTGLDLVALQIAIADGGRLPADPPPPRGHAIEARLYAEDPTHDWQPQTGTLHRFDISSASVVGSGVRVDAGVVDGSVIGPHYDPMLAKVIAWAPDRAGAARLLAGTLARAKIHGLITNRDLLVRVLRHPAFLAGETDTAFFDRHGLDTLAAPLADTEAEALSVLAAALADAAANRENAPVLGRLPTGWRNVRSAPQHKRYKLIGDTHQASTRGQEGSSRRVAEDANPLGETHQGSTRGQEEGSRRVAEDADTPGSAFFGDEWTLVADGYVVSYQMGRSGLVLDDVVVAADDGGPGTQWRQHGVPVEASPARVVLEVGGVRRAFEVARYDGLVCVDSASGAVMLRPVPRFGDPAGQVAAGSLLAPMPGTVIRVAVAPGDRVVAGEPMLWLEAMKMEHTIAAPSDGVVTELAVKAGQQVDVGVVLAVVKEES